MVFYPPSSFLPPCLSASLLPFKYQSFHKLQGEHKPLGGETRPSDTEGGGKEDCHIQTEGENSVRNSKQAVEKSLPFSDKPAGQELPQSEGSLADQTETPARGQKFRGDNKQVKQERNDEKNQGDAESNQETANDVTKGGKDQGKQGIAVEKINRNDEQNRQDPQEERSKNQPSKAESEGFQPDQEVDGASQLVSKSLMKCLTNESAVFYFTETL